MVSSQAPAVGRWAPRGPAWTDVFPRADPEQVGGAAVAPHHLRRDRGTRSNLHGNDHRHRCLPLRTRWRQILARGHRLPEPISPAG
eukprot:1670713-Pyramimonas_sp.AAC.1